MISIRFSGVRVSATGFLCGLTALRSYAASSIARALAARLRASRVSSATVASASAMAYCIPLRAPWHIRMIAPGVSSAMSAGLHEVQAETPRRRKGYTTAHVRVTAGVA